MTADRQTTGGYAKIGVVSRSGLNRLAQRIPGDSISFCRMSADAAQEEFLREEALLKKWQESMGQRTSDQWILTINGQPFSVTIREKE
jgi:allophanate hydrolase subunit 2